MTIVLLDAFLADQGGLDTWPELEQLGTIARYDRTAPEEVVSRLQSAAVAVTNKVIIDEPVLAACPELKHIAITATGTNVVDLEACKSRGVAVTHVPAYSTDSVSQHVFSFILDDASAVARHDEKVRDGDWASCTDFCFTVRPTWELAGKRIAIIGYGDIGATVATIAQAFGVKVDIVQLPWRPQKEGRVPLTEALPEADIISLHCPLTPQTEHLVNAEFLGHCKENVLLINTGRGPLINEPVLADWLQAHPASRATVDVLSTEPPAKDNPLLGHPQVRITPHIAWATIEARARLRAEVVKNIRVWSEQGECNRVV